jgi:cysteine synthase B
MRRIDSVLEAVGRTPLVRLRNVGRNAPDVPVYAKLELANPGGSVKDRAALSILRAAIASGELRGKTLIDATSGNTGVAYAMYGAALGVPIRLVMPANVSQARKDIARAFGAELTFSDRLEGSDGAIRVVAEMMKTESARFWHADQYSNPNNPRAHYEGTGAEILEAVGDRITHFVAGIGTTGTMMGTTRRLKEAPRPIRCIAVQPAEALHGLDGLKHLAASLVPAIYDPHVPDETRFVGTEDGWTMADRLACEEGLHVGHSSGANVHAAVKLAEEVQAKGERGLVVVIACDRGDRYFAPVKWERKTVW